jgi:type II secretory pathway component HofQ
MKTRFLTLGLSLLTLLFLGAQEPGKITRSYNVSPEEIQNIKTTLEGIISGQGKIIVVEKAGKIIVQDLPSSFAAIDEVIKAFHSPPPNVRIEILSKTFGNHSQRQLEVRGRTQIGGVSVGNREENGIGVDLGNASGSNDSLNSSFLVVRSGGSASLEVAKDVPFIDYFWSYARGLGLVTATQVRWEKIGTQLAIRPRVFGNQIQVDVIPQIRKLSADFFEPEGVISFQTLQTTVTVTDGSTIEIGGLAQADRDFLQHFFGVQRGESTEETKITLSASILR